MRLLIAIIIIMLAFYFLMPEPAPKPVEETFVGKQIQPLRKAESFQTEYLKADAEHQKKLEEELEKGGG